MVSITGKVNHQIVIEASIVIEHIKVTVETIYSQVPKCGVLP